MQRRFQRPSAFLAWATIFLFFLGGCGDDDPAEPAGTSCAIAFTEPSPGNQFLTSETVNLRWSAEGGGQVRLALLRAQGEQGEIVAVTENDGYFRWAVSTLGGPSADDYAVAVTSLDEAACADTLRPLRLVDMAGCTIDPTVRQTTVDEGDELRILWASGNTSGTVDIDLFYGPLEGDLIGPLAGGILDDGEFLWEDVDSFHHGTGNLYFVRISDARAPYCYGVNATPFTIVDDNVCTIDVRTPVAYSTHVEGSTVRIEFETQQTSGTVDLRLYAGTTTPLDHVATRVLVAENGVSWRIAVDDMYTGPDNMYRVLVHDAEDGYCRGFSPPFTIDRVP